MHAAAIVGDTCRGARVFVERCIAAIETHGLDHVGIYRESGVKSKLEHIANQGLGPPAARSTSGPRLRARQLMVHARSTAAQTIRRRSIWTAKTSITSAAP